MSRKVTKPEPRKQRTDAQRNRERILEAAKDAFTRYGANASLDDIARQAVVGPGLYTVTFPQGMRSLRVSITARSRG